MGSVVAVLTVAAYLFAMMAAIFLALLKRRQSTSYLAIATILLAIQFSLIESGVYDTTVSLGLPLVDDLLASFTSVLTMLRLALSVSSAAFLSLAVFALGMELKAPKVSKPTYYEWKNFS